MGAISSRVTLSAGMKRSASGRGALSSTPSSKRLRDDRSGDRNAQIEREQEPPAADFAETMPRGYPLQLAFQIKTGLSD